MMYVNKSNRNISIIAIIFFISMNFYTTVQAALVTTQQVSGSNHQQQIRQQLRTTLQREDIQQQLLELGVEPQQVLTRVNSMTDTEVQELASMINETPAGSGIVGLVGLALVVFVITDLLKVTNVFNF